jgi:hypothetical protein
MIRPVLRQDKMVKFPQRYQNSHGIFRNLLCSKNFRHFCGSQNWLFFSRPILGAYSTRTSPSIPPSDDLRTSPHGVLSDAQIQLISGHERNKSLEIYQHLSLGGRTGVSGGCPGAQHPMDTQRCQNHGPMRLLVLLWEFNLFAKPGTGVTEIAQPAVSISAQ